ncbi:6705_t:CDS:2, partial [Paraglomus occultum]
SVLDCYLQNNLSDEAVRDSAVFGLQFAGLCGQLVGIDVLDKSLYVGFEGPTCRFPAQLSDIAALQPLLEILYFFKVRS